MRMYIVATGILCSLICMSTALTADNANLVGHWKLQDDCLDYSGSGNNGINHGVTFTDGKSGDFNGTNACIEIPASKSIDLGDGDFTMSAWVNTEKDLDDLIGDIASKYDPVSRKGFNFSILTNSGVVSAQPNYRALHFGIDNTRIDPQWTDCGRPGTNLMIWSLCSVEGSLYAGTVEWCQHEAGHVYRYAGGQKWVDCGKPDKCNAVSALTAFEGKLYAGGSRYLFVGSALPDSPNTNPGGSIYRYEGRKKWVYCGTLSNPETGESVTVGGLTVFNGKLYATAVYNEGKGLYRYDGDTKWTYCGNPKRRVSNPFVFNGSMYMVSYDVPGSVFRYDVNGRWTDVGKKLGLPEKLGQTYSFAAYQGRMYLATWPYGTVYRYDDGDVWADCGRLGEESEVMGMLVYNGKLYGGTLPSANVYRFDGDRTWTQIGQQLDTSLGIYRRAWSTAIHDGKLFFGTLPSGHIFSIEAGKNVTWDRELPPGWQHVTAVRDGDMLKLYVNGKFVSSSSKFTPSDYDISNNNPLLIGFGANDYFNGRIRDMRLYNKALTAREVKEIVNAK
ncbi:MAG: LamG domain-containing protein [Armatimonadota bacterium]